ncbi:hypothetical protein T05_13250 [Trichinella murrelli]|uniref:Uncharacterized protein n=1 Tax=Trichinella murrelli TaxID=144512 RepID=A0A0V0U4X3_9BILA|nr:hypothetical protein T05_13250 [Trichinella murrelli]
MDAASEQSPATNDSNRTMNNRKRPTATYDSEIISLTDGMDRLQAHCTRATDMEAIRDVSTALERTEQRFFDSRQLRLVGILE